MAQRTISEQEQLTTYQPDLQLIADQGEDGPTVRITSDLLVSQASGIIDWTAGGYVTGQKRQYENLVIEATTSFTSSTVTTELEGGKWKVIGGRFSINTVANGETFIIPPNVTGISTELTVQAGGTLTILTGGVLANFGTYTNNGTINGADRIQNKAL